MQSKDEAEPTVGRAIASPNEEQNESDRTRERNDGRDTWRIVTHSSFEAARVLVYMLLGVFITLGYMKGYLSFLEMSLISTMVAGIVAMYLGGGIVPSSLTRIQKQSELNTQRKQKAGQSCFSDDFKIKRAGPKRWWVSRVNCVSVACFGMRSTAS
jgi:hypothetical protein